MLSSKRRAKIVCTLGPSTDDPAILEALVRAGMNAVRLNLSFDRPEKNRERIRAVRAVSEKVGHHVAVILDVPGPRVRVLSVPAGREQVAVGETVSFSKSRAADAIEVDESFFHDDMISGDRLLLAEGLVELEVRKVERDRVRAEVVAGGPIAPFSTVYLPAMILREGPLGAADDAHLRLAVEEAVDYLALTYVRNAEDLLHAREKLEALGAKIPLIAKIERPEAFARLDGILERADAVMIRRGDLGASVPLTRVPTMQKDIVRIANQAGIPVIIATQMLGSMIAAPRPTRAEASDVSNAIVDGADGVMLSSETAIGRYPLRAFEMMGKIIGETEREMREHPTERPFPPAPSDFADTTAGIAVLAARQTGAKLIACFTESGRTAGLVAKYRPSVSVVALCHRASTERRLALSWGVHSATLEPVYEAEAMVRAVDDRLLGASLVRRGDRIVIVYGAPVGEMGHTNSVRLHKVGSTD